MTTRERISNFELDIKLAKRDWEYEAYVSEMNEKRRKFYEENPDCPFKTMYMVVCAPKQTISIKYID